MEENQEIKRRGRPKKEVVVESSVSPEVFKKNGHLLPYREGETIPYGESRYFLRGNSLVKAFRKKRSDNKYSFCTKHVTTLKDHNPKSKRYLQSKELRKKLIKDGIPGA